MSGDDPLKAMLLKVILSFMMAIGIVFVLKPFIVVAAGFWICANCNTTVFLLATAIVFTMVIGVPLYRLIGVFYN